MYCIHIGTHFGQTVYKGRFTMEKKKEVNKDKKGTKRDNPAAYPPSKTDPEGWYTGRPENVLEKPVQDADDL